MPHSLESHRELGCLENPGVREELVKVPSHPRKLGPPRVYWNLGVGAFLQNTFDLPGEPDACPGCTLSESVE